MTSYLHKPDSHYQDGHGDRRVSDEEYSRRWARVFKEGSDNDNACVQCNGRFEKAEFDYNGFVSGYCRACRDSLGSGT